MAGVRSVNTGTAVPEEELEWLACTSTNGVTL